MHLIQNIKLALELVKECVTKLLMYRVVQGKLDKYLYNVYIHEVP